MSVVHIIYPETMDEEKQLPRAQGLNDTKLGTIDRMFQCATCKEDIQTCPGHFGHIELAVPVFHVGECCWLEFFSLRGLLTTYRFCRENQEAFGDRVPQLRLDPG